MLRTDRCLSRIRASGFDGPVLLVDNGSDPCMEDLAARHQCEYHRNAVNCFVNPVWNWLFEIVRERYLTLLNNDCLPRDGYLDEVTSIMRRWRLALASPVLREVEAVDDLAGDLSAETGPPDIDNYACRRGDAMTIDLKAYRKCAFVIPNRYMIWYGDDWIWGQLRYRGYRCGVIRSRSCMAEFSKTLLSNSSLQDRTRVEAAMAASDPLILRMQMFSGEVTCEHLRRHRRRPVTQLLRLCASSAEEVGRVLLFKRSRRSNRLMREWRLIRF